MIGWLRLATHLHLPLQVVMRQTTSTEFLMWMEYLDEEEGRNKKYEFYLANIIAETRRSWVKNPSKVKLTDFLFHPESRDKKPEVKAASPDKDKLDAYKQIWFTATGLNSKKKVQRKR